MGAYSRKNSSICRGSVRSTSIPSLLPQYRGATPIQTALANGETETGVSIMLMDAGLDTGDLVAQERLAIEPGRPTASFTIV